MTAGKCTCVSCGTCIGTGRQWFQWYGVEESEPCDDCDGSGVTETCESCMDAREVENE